VNAVSKGTVPATHLWGCARAETGEPTARAFITVAILQCSLVWLLSQLAGEAGVQREGEERGKEGRAGGLSGAEGGESERGDWVVVCPKDSHPSSPLDSGSPF